MLTARDVRRIAVGMKDAVEGAHMGHPDFRVNGRVFASLHDDDQFAMVKLTPEQQASFIGGHPGTFSPEAGAWGLQGYTRVRLASVDEETFGEALTLAWQNTAAKRAAAPRRPRGRK